MGSLLRIAFRNVLRNRRRSLITFAAVFFALMVMVTLRGFINGLMATVRDSVVNGQTGALQIHKQGFSTSLSGASLEQNIPADDALLSRISAVPGVKAVAPRIAFGAMANANDVTSVTLVTAIDPVHEPQVCPGRAEMISSGKTLGETGPASAIVTPELAASLGLQLGQRAAILANDGEGVLNALDVDLVGYYGQPGLPLPERKIAFVPLAFAQELLRMEGRATEIAVSIDRLDDAERMKTVLQAAIGPGLEVSSWHDVAPWVDDVVAAYRFMLGACTIIFLTVALLGVVNTMLMSVFERTREIGTMMSVGVRRRQILALFLIEAALLGLSGGVLGAAVGDGIVLYMGHHGIAYKLGEMAAPMHVFPRIELGSIVLVLLLATAGTVLAALWPAFRASRMRPVEALASV